MSELATEICDTTEKVTTIEFFGSTFAERRQALALVNAFGKLAELALADSVAVHAGKEVGLTFRPSSAIMRQYNYSFPCYSLFDEVREPIVDQVTIRAVDELNMTARVTKGELLEGKYDQEWTVRLHNILALELPEPSDSAQ